MMKISWISSSKGTLHSDKEIENNAICIYIYNMQINRERSVVGNELGQSSTSFLKRDDG